MSQLSAGRTVCDVYNKLEQPTNARVGYGLDVDRFWEMLIEVLVAY